MAGPYKAWLALRHADVEALALPAAHTNGKGPLVFLNIKSGSGEVHVSLRPDEAARIRDVLSEAVDYTRRVS